MHWQTHGRMCDRCSLESSFFPAFACRQSASDRTCVNWLPEMFQSDPKQDFCYPICCKGMYSLTTVFYRTVAFSYSEGLCPSVNACSDRLYFSVHVEFNDVGRYTFSVLICFLLIWWWWWFQKPYLHRSCLARSSPFRIRSTDRQCHQNKNCSVSSSDP